MVNVPTICGTKDESWLMVVVKDVQVHFILEEYRDELDLEFRWLNDPPIEMRKKWKMYEKMGKNGGNMDIDDDTFRIKTEEEAEYFK
jgi:hypothetical protein